MSNFFHNRTQVTKIENFITEPVSIFDGTPQGSGLSGTCFNIYYNDVQYLLKLFAILFADDTTLSESNVSAEKLIAVFKSKFEPLLEWCRTNRLFINWKKTKAMFIHKKNSIILPDAINFGNESVEVVNSFKLLGVTIDSKLSFNTFINETKKSINAKIYSFKKLYYLSKNVKSHFFKAFIQPHFDYCAALTIYLNKTKVNSLGKFHKIVLFRLLKLKLFGLDCVAQLPLLNHFKLLPYQMRLCSRLSIFSHKVMNKIFLSSFRNKLSFKENCCNLNSCNGNCVRRKELVSLPNINTDFGRHSFSYFLPKFLNYVLKDNYLMNVNDFRLFIKNNFLSFYELFIKNFF